MMSTTTTSSPTLTTPAAPPPVIPSPHLLASLYRMTIDRYERLVEAGLLDHPQVELINGWLVTKMSKKPTHVISTGRLARRLEGLLPPGWHLRKEEPVRIPDFDEPEPDLAIAASALEDYPERHPGSGEVAVAVEVSDTTLDRDQDEKKAAYARGGIPYYWIVNLVDRQVEVYADPRGGRYQDCHIFPSGAGVPVVVAGVEVGRIPVDAILPPARPTP
jgi:Uma2 family endonuclease